jgi:two-component system chemotaxis sensor kinase CheA
MDELIGEFLAETSESLDVIDEELVKFEADPTDRATLDNIFRLLHTIKGTCGFLGSGKTGSHRPRRRNLAGQVPRR